MGAATAMMYEGLELQVGDAVTPTSGAYAEQPFVVMELRSESGPGSWKYEARIRPAVAKRGAPVPEWVPFSDLKRLFGAGQCRVCGVETRVHSWCVPRVFLPDTGIRVRLRQAMRMEATPHELHAGMEGRVVPSDPRWKQIVIELDEVLVDGDERGGFLYVAAEDFWDLFEVV